MPVNGGGKKARHGYFLNWMEIASIKYNQS